jgi:predicted component of type VI protein secretion system
MERDGDQFGVVLPAEAKASGARFFLELSASESLQVLPMKMMTARISNPGRIEFLRTNALPGVPAEAQPSPPAELPRGQTGTYYRLKHEETEWASHVAPAGDLAVFIMESPADLNINLVVVLPGG